VIRGIQQLRASHPQLLLLYKNGFDQPRIHGNIVPTLAARVTPTAKNKNATLQ
jgi:hypothetical protein